MFSSYFCFLPLLFYFTVLLDRSLHYSRLFFKFVSLNIDLYSANT